MKKFRSVILFVLSVFLLHNGCVLFMSVERVDIMEERQIEMSEGIDSLETRLTFNENLLRQLQAQSGTRASELLDRLYILASELEMALQNLRSETGNVQISQDTIEGPGARLIYDEAYMQYQRRDYIASSEGFLELIELYPSSSLADDAFYFLGMSHESEEKSHEAIEVFLGLYFRYPQSERAAAALYRAANIYGSHNAPLDKIRLLELLISKYPSSEEAGLAGDQLD